MPTKKTSSTGIPSVFLAGTCSDGNEWRHKVLDYFSNEMDNNTVILLDPYDEDWEASENIYRELSDIAISDKIIFYKGGEGSSKEQEFLDKLGRNYEIHSALDSVINSIESLITSREGLSAVELHEGDIITVEGIPIELTTPATAISNDANIEIVKDALESAEADEVDEAAEENKTQACLKKVTASLAYEHGCVMIPAPAYVRAYFLKDFLADTVNQDQLVLDKDDTIFGIETDSHITVLYGVDGEHGDDMLATIKEQFPEPLSIKTGTEVAYFDNENSTAVYVPIECPELEELHASLKDMLDNEESRPDYIPHLCLAYLKPGERLANNTVKPMAWTATVLVISGKDAHMSSVSCGDEAQLTESLVDSVKNIFAEQE